MQLSAATLGQASASQHPGRLPRQPPASPVSLVVLAGPGGSSQRLDGIHVVLEALRARRRVLHRLCLAGGEGPKGRDLAAVVHEAERAGVPIEEVPASELRSGRSGTPQRVVLEAGPLPEEPLEGLWAEEGEDRRIVLLDGVEDPQNFGAIARVAEAAGARGIVTARRRAAPLSLAATRASAGALEWLPVARVANLARAVKSLKENGFWMIGADVDAPDSVYDLAPDLLRGDLVIALGAEGRGLRQILLKEADHRVRIPMEGRVGSLNVSAAGAVLLFELVRRARSS